jgi:hypothetical protein
MQIRLSKKANIPAITGAVNCIMNMLDEASGSITKSFSDKSITFTQGMSREDVEFELLTAVIEKHEKG